MAAEHLTVPAASVRIFSDAVDLVGVEERET